MSRKLNNLLKRQGTIDQIKAFLKDGTHPKHPKLTPELLAEFELDGDDLVWKPQHLTVVEPDDVNDVINEEWQDLSKSAGLGIKKLYEVIADTYLGITREAVRKYLQSNPKYQLSRPYVKAVNKPILAKKANERWMIDLVDMNPLIQQNNGYRYILTCIDVFTRFLWTRKLKKKEAVEVRDALESISREAEAHPDICQSDQGKEFKSEVSQWCSSHNTKQIFVKSYSPRSQGLIESTNRFMREKLRDAMIRNETRTWTGFLADCTSSWNRTPHGQQKHSPEYLYLSPSDDVDEERQEARRIQEDRARRVIARNKNKEFSVGDVVRVSLAATTAQIRKQRKTSGTYKNVIAKWSPELYKIKSIVKPDNADRVLPFNSLQKLQYTLTELATGRPLRTQRLITDRATQQRRAGRFFASELQLVAKSGQPIPEGAELPRNLASKLNRLQDSEAEAVAVGDQDRRRRIAPATRSRSDGGSASRAEAQPPRRSGRSRRARREEDFEYSDLSDSDF